jgi:hypothetical protein
MDTHMPPTVALPAPTAWPIVFAFGVTLLLAGLVTHAAVTIVGALAALAASVGWFREVLPVEAMEHVPIVDQALPIVTGRPTVARLGTAPLLHRPRLPIEMYPISAGIKGGLAGGAAMAGLAMAYGVLSEHGLWYPINLLAVGLVPAAGAAASASAADVLTSPIAAFNLTRLLLATLIHLTGSLLVGVLYGATLPMVPRHPIVLGGLLAPLAWSGVLHGCLEIINPVLNARIDWFWFVLSQVAFGLVAGFVVAQQERIQTWQDLPLAVRVGMAAPGLMDARSEQDDRR